MLPASRERFADAVSVKSASSSHGDADSQSQTAAKSSSQSEASATSSRSWQPMADLLGVSGLQAAKAEAVAALCRIFSAKSARNTHVAQPYLLKFYALVLECLAQVRAI